MGPPKALYKASIIMMRVNEAVMGGTSTNHKSKMKSVSIMTGNAMVKSKNS